MSQEMNNPDRWKELADLLGLPPDHPDAMPPEPAPRDPAPLTRDPDPIEPPTMDVFEQLPPETPPASSFPISDPMGDVEETSEPEPRVTELSGEKKPVRDEEEEDRPRRGRRRGRRRKGRRDEGEVASADKAEPGGVQEESGDAEEKRADADEHDARNGSRGADDESEGIDNHDDIDEAPRQSPALDEEDDDGENPMDKLGEWNIPSWNELIGSLYRPDR